MTAKLDSSRIDWTALEAAAEQWQGLRDALRDTANGIAGAAKAHVATSHKRYAGRGLPYRVSVRIYTGNGLPRAVLRAPLGAFLGVKSPAGRHQTKAWGHPVSLYHGASDYVLRDAAGLFDMSSSIFG